MKNRGIIYTALFLFMWLPVAHSELIDETVISHPDDTHQEANNENVRPDLKAIQKRFDTSKITANVKHYVYNPDHTYKVNLREFMNSLIVLPVYEKIIDFTLGDSKNFKFTPRTRKKGNGPGNIFEVSAKYFGCDTNLSVIGSTGNIYSFYLRHNGISYNVDPDLVVYIDAPKALKPTVQSKQPVVGTDGESVVNVANPELIEGDADCVACNEDHPPEEQYKEDYLRELPKIEPTDVNWNYTTSKGKKRLKPYKIFDDGFFTYFQFGKGNFDKTAQLPVVYKVLDGYDTPVNSRIVDGFIVAETLSEKWTIRAGDDYLCVRRTDK